MKRKNVTRNALFTSILSLLLCVSMLVGTTFAWFTDSVVSGTNVITAGNLDVDVYTADGNSIQDVDTLFNDVTLWEPGAVAWENLTVVNEGNLALKYQLALNFKNATETAQGSGKTLADVLKVAVVAGGFSGTREAATALAYNYSLRSFALEGKLAEKAASDVYGIVIYWAPTANDNDYNVAGGLSIDLGVNLFATQLTAENDSFDNNYDVDAWEDTKNQRPEVGNSAANISSDGSASMEVNAAPSATTNKTIVDAPAGSFDSTDKVEVEVETTNSLFNVTADGNGVVAKLAITMTVNGTETSADLEAGKYYTVTTYISTGLSNVTVAYTGTDGKAQPTEITYDAVTGKLTFKTNHFSEYAVAGAALAYDAKNDTAMSTVQQVITATQAEGNTVVIPEINKDAIEDEIKQLPAEEQEAAAAATAAAKIGDVTYATLADAFKAANDNDIIVVQNNVALKDAPLVCAGKQITLDLNGKTLDGTATSNTTSYLIKVEKGAGLTIMNGTVTFLATKPDVDWVKPDFPGYANNTISCSGKLVIVNAVIENRTAKGGASYAIDCYPGADVTVESGKVNGFDKNAIRTFANSGTESIKVTINGGEIVGSRAVWIQLPSSNASIAPLVELTVNGGTLTSNDETYNLAVYSYSYGNDASGTNIALNGGTINGNVVVGGGTKIGKETVIVGADCTINGEVYRYLANDGVEYIYTDGMVSDAKELEHALAVGGNIVLANDIEITKTLLVKKDVVINLNGKTVTASFTGNMFQSSSDTDPSMTITSTAPGAKINALGGNISVLLGYGSTVINNVTIYVESSKSSSYNPFKVYGDLTLGEGTVVNVGYLGTSLINNNGANEIVIDGAKINVDTFKVNGGAMISLTRSATLALKGTEVNVGLDTTYPSYFISNADNATIEGCTFDVTDANGATYDIEFKPDANVGAKYAWVKCN